MRWLILGGRANGLAVARALDFSSAVYVLDCGKEKPVTAFSRYVNQVFLVEPSFPEVASFLDSFLSSEESILIATDDWWVYQISRYKQNNGKFFYGFFPSLSLLEIILDKQALYACLQDFIRVPYVTSVQDIAHLDGFIIKPKLSFNEGGIVEKGVNDFLAYNKLGVEVLIQKKIEAPLESHLSICGIYVNGEIRFPFFSHKVMEYPSPMGTATMVQNVRDPFLINGLLKNAKIVFSKIDYSGIFELEFIEANGEFWFIDFNPRFWLQHGMATKIGINYAQLYSELSMNNESLLSPDLNYSKNLIWVHEGVPLSFLRAKGKIRILLMIVMATLNFAHFKINDMKPFWHFLICKLKR